MNWMQHKNHMLPIHWFGNNLITKKCSTHLEENERTSECKFRPENGAETKRKLGSVKHYKRSSMEHISQAANCQYYMHIILLLISCREYILFASHDFDTQTRTHTASVKFVFFGSQTTTTREYEITTTTTNVRCKQRWITFSVQIFI